MVNWQIVMNVGFLAKTKWPAIRQGTPAGNEMRTARSVVGQIGPFCVGFLRENEVYSLIAENKRIPRKI